MKICLNMKELQDKLLSVESRIANYSSARNVKILSSHIEDISEKNGKFNIKKMWKQRKKLCHKSLEKPSAKINEKGKLVTQKKEPKELYKNTYISRLRNREILPQYETIFKLKNYLRLYWCIHWLDFFCVHFVYSPFTAVFRYCVYNIH